MKTKLSFRVALAWIAAMSLQCQTADEFDVIVELAPSSFDAVIQPIFVARCAACHGAEKSKGGLRLHTREALLAGGESGPMWTKGEVGSDAETSELVRRLRLPLDDPDHMPPDDKPQPSEAEVRAIEMWIASGASFDAVIDGLRAPEPERELAPIAPPDERALAALRSELVHVQPVDARSSGLWVDFAAVAVRVDDRFAVRLLEPVREQVVELSLARSRVGAPTLAFLATLPHLRRLDLRGCAVDDAALAALVRPMALEELVLARTSITDASLDALATWPNLRRVFVWKCAVSPEGIARLRGRSDLWVDAGDVPDATIAAVEPAPKFTSDAPIPGAPLPGDPDAPINATCPVTGSPVNPKFTLRHEGRVIGFCCPNCPPVFQKNPNGFAVKTP